jgi:hypothetical protein
MELSSFRQTASRSVNQKFPVWWKPKFPCRVHKCLPHWSLPWARQIQSIPLDPFSLTSILILSSHLRLGLPSGRFPSSFPTMTATCRRWGKCNIVPVLNWARRYGNLDGRLRSVVRITHLPFDNSQQSDWNSSTYDSLYRKLCKPQIRSRRYGKDKDIKVLCSCQK